MLPGTTIVELTNSVVSVGAIAILQTPFRY